MSNKCTMLSNQEAQEVIINLDVDKAMQMYPAPIHRHSALIGLHKARYQLKAAPAELRHASRAWLAQYGCVGLFGEPLLPEGELP